MRWTDNENFTNEDIIVALAVIALLSGLVTYLAWSKIPAWMFTRQGVRALAGFLMLLIIYLRLWREIFPYNKGD